MNKFKLKLNTFSKMENSSVCVEDIQLLHLKLHTTQALDHQTSLQMTVKKISLGAQDICKYLELIKFFNINNFMNLKKNFF